MDYVNKIEERLVTLLGKIEDKSFIVKHTIEEIESLNKEVYDELGKYKNAYNNEMRLQVNRAGEKNQEQHDDIKKKQDIIEGLQKENKRLRAQVTRLKKKKDEK